MGNYFEGVNAMAREANLIISHKDAELAAKDARIAELEAKTIEWMKVCTRKGEEHFLKELHRSRAETEALRKQLAEFGAGEDTTTMSRKSFAEVLQALADVQKELNALKEPHNDPDDLLTQLLDPRFIGQEGLRLAAAGTIQWMRKTEEALRKELAEAKAALTSFNFVQMHHRQQELSSALEAANARIAELDRPPQLHEWLKRLSEALARAERAEARIAELEASPRESFFWPTERVRTELCVAVDRAERTESALEAAHIRIAVQGDTIANYRASAERAEAECKVMREALERVVAKCPKLAPVCIAAEALAALNPSREG